MNFQLHDFRFFRLAVPKTSDQRGSLYDVLMQVTKICCLFVLSSYNDLRRCLWIQCSSFLRFQEKGARMEKGIWKGSVFLVFEALHRWNVYVAESEWLRQFDRLRALKMEVKLLGCLSFV